MILLAEPAPPMFVMGNGYEAPPVVGYAPAVTCAYAALDPVVEYLAPAPTTAYATPVTNMTAVPTVVPTATLPISTTQCSPLLG